MRYPDRESYRRAWDAVFEGVDPPIPLNIDLELSSACNLRCPFCYRSDPAYDHQFPRTVMSPSLALNVLNEAAELAVPAVKLNWRGEPTLHPDFAIIAHHAKALGFYDVLLNTNGNWRDPAQTLQGVMACTMVAFSLDSCSPVTYPSIRVGGDYEAVIANIRRTIELGHGGVELRRVVSDLNRHENFTTDCETIFGPAQDATTGRRRYRVVEHAVFDRGSMHKTIKEATIDRAYCGQPSQRLVVAASGDIMPCCMDVWERVVLGNIGHGDTLAWAWRSPTLAAIRMAGRTAQLPDDFASTLPCWHCESWSAYADQRRGLLRSGQ